MNRLSCCIFIFFLLVTGAYAQPSDSLRARLAGPAPYAKFILPGALITYGALTHAIRPLRRLDEKLDKAVGEHPTKIDDYLMFAPAAAVYGLDWAGLKAKHNFRERTFVMLSSHLLMLGSTHAVKHAAGVMRPDGSAPNSFPSGHTAAAFTGAHILMREYGSVSPWPGVAGYAAAAATGFLRIQNHRHWLSDVAAGAGLGILCAEAGYLLLPLFRKLADGGATALTIAPLAGGQVYGLGLACRF